MPLWEERWDTWCLVYLVFAMLVAGWEFGRVSAPVAISVVTGVWIVAQRAALGTSRRTNSMFSGLASALLQLMFLVWSGLWVFGASEALAKTWPVAILLLAGAAAATLSVEGKMSEPLPRYGIEALVITCFCAGYMFVNGKGYAKPVVSWMIVHSAIVVVAVLRNSWLVVERVQGPTAENAVVSEKWSLRYRQIGVLRGITAALMLPSGALGLGLLAIESLVFTASIWAEGGI